MKWEEYRKVRGKREYFPARSNMAGKSRYPSVMTQKWVIGWILSFPMADYKSKQVNQKYSSLHNFEFINIFIF